MGTRGDGLAIGTEKLNGLLAWWGGPGANDKFETRFRRFQEFATDLQKASAEAASHEISAIFETREQFVDAMRQLVQSEQPEDFLAAEAAIAASYFNVLAEQAKRWAAFAEKAHACCTDLAREVSEASHKDTGGSKPAPRNVHAHEAPRHAAE